MTLPNNIEPFNILLVEDEDPKLQHISRFIRELDSPVILSTARSVNSAMDEIDTQFPDLLLLDMSLPTFEIKDRESGGRPQGFGGIEILRQLAMSGRLCQAIVITGYEAFPSENDDPVDITQLNEKLSTEFPNMFRGLLHYNSTYDEWKQTLLNYLNQFVFFSGNQS